VAADGGTARLIIHIEQIILWVPVMVRSGVQLRPTRALALLLAFGTVVVVGLCGLSLGLEEGQDTIEIVLPEGTDPAWVPVGEPLLVNVTLFTAEGDNLTASAEFAWNLTPDISSWMLTDGPAIRLWPESTGVLTVRVTSFLDGNFISTSIELELVNTVHDVKLERDPPAKPVLIGDVVYLTVNLYDHAGLPIMDEGEFCWSADSGHLTHTPGFRRVAWVQDELGTHTVTVHYTLGPQHGVATYTLEVQRRLSSIELGDIPDKVEVLTPFNTTVRVLDSEGEDMTGAAVVAVVMTSGNVSDLEWTWDGEGTLSVRPVVPGPVEFQINADLNGSVVSVPVSLHVTGSLPEEETGNYTDVFEVLGPAGVVTIVSVVTTIILGPVVLEQVRRKRRMEGDLLATYARYLDTRRSEGTSKYARRRARELARARDSAEAGLFTWSDDGAEDDL